jgi:hypothetical protein
MRQRLLPSAGRDYPQRPAYFALHYLRLVLDFGSTAEIGDCGYVLLSIIVMAEDRLRYSRAPTFWSAHFESLTGWDAKKVSRVRKRLVEAGLLHYERTSRRRQGIYWVLQPAGMELPESYFATPATPATPQPVTKEKPVLNEGGSQTNTVNFARNDDLNRDRIPALNDDRNRVRSSIPLPNPNPPPSPHAGEWAELEIAMIRAGIFAPEKPLEKLRAHQVPASLALGVIHYASETGAWDAGKVRRRLITLLPGDDPGDVTAWPAPDRPHKLPRVVAASTETERTAAAQRQRDVRRRQLELEFGPVLQGETPRTIVSRFQMPPAIADHMAGYESFEAIQRRCEPLWVAVLEHIQQHLTPAARTN